MTFTDSCLCGTKTGKAITIPDLPVVLVNHKADSKCSH